jgi:hypothetical protein
MTKEHLIPLKKGSKRASELGRKGGRSKSPKKQLASRINGLLANKKLTDDQRYMLTMMKDKNYSEVLNEMISMNVERSDNDIEIRNKAIDQLQKFMPTKVMSINTNINIDVEKDSEEAKEHLKKILGDL